MHKVIVINAVDLVSANEFCNSIGAQGETFSVGLYNSEELLVGYWCGWNVSDEQLAALEADAMFQIFDTAQEALSTTGWHPYQGE